MNGVLEELREIADCEIELEELSELGDLEAHAECARKLHALKAALASVIFPETNVPSGRE